MSESPPPSIDDTDDEGPTVPTPEAADPSPPEPATSARPARPRAILASVVALAALLLAGYSTWQAMQAQQAIERIDLASHADADAQLAARITALDDSHQALRTELERIGTRQQDSLHVGEGVREELLSLAERSRHLEDAVANLARQRASSRDVLALNEAEYLLQVAAQQLELFHDGAAARQAYQLADSALAGVADPLFTAVRQTIASELRLIDQAGLASPTTTITALERLRGQLMALPLRRHADDPENTQDDARWLQLLSRFVRIERVGDETPQVRDPQRARLLPAIDIRAAQAAALARDADAYAIALAHIEESVPVLFDPAAPAVQAVRDELSRLRGIPIAFDLPELGSALRELRNLRAMQSLSSPPPASPPDDDAADDDASDASSGAALP